MESLSMNRLFTKAFKASFKCSGVCGSCDCALGAQMSF